MRIILSDRAGCLFQISYIFHPFHNVFLNTYRKTTGSRPADMEKFLIFLSSNIYSIEIQTVHCKIGFGGTMYSSIMSGAVFGIRSYLMKVETDISEGLPMFTMVGFMSGEVREAGERVRVALRNAGYHMPTARITVNLAPADIPKRGIVIDLPVAVSILISMQVLDQHLVENLMVIGELGLAGEIRPVRGALPIIAEGSRSHIKGCIVPMDNYFECAAVEGIRIMAVRTLRDVLTYLQSDEEQRAELEAESWQRAEKERAEASREKEKEDIPDFSGVRGQEMARRALEIAAAGFHNILMIGPPGSGKTMMARCLPGILPPLTPEESMEVSTIYSVAGKIPKGMSKITERPFVAPHFSVTPQALAGGGIIPGPGAISLAHRGVLFLDEFPEFGREKINLLRQPIEDHEISIIRASGNAVFPTRFMLVAAANPCPCGYYPNPQKCSCTYAQIHRYRKKISGPVLDRIDLSTSVSAVDAKALFSREESESSASIRKRVIRARQRQLERFAGRKEQFNSDMDGQAVEMFCRLDVRTQRSFMRIFEEQKMSARAYHRMLKVARTIADLDGCDEIREEHLMEASRLRLSEGSYR